jgi:hypothetical protein
MSSSPAPQIQGVAGCFALAAVIVGALLPLSRPTRAVPGNPVEIADGLVEGTREDNLTIYRGIPYASPPVGELRWRPPARPQPWQGVLKATAFKPACPQIGAVVPGMEVQATREDCLYLNIWTAASRPTAPLPVMVWLYGGNNTNGSGSARLYWGDRLAHKGVLVVTFNYRLGALGLLAHRDLSRESVHGVSGNYLLLDQIALLHWVQSNIAKFGGNPGNVTIFGQSAGAYDISNLMVSPLAKGLFQRAIAESGGDLGPVDTRDGPPVSKLPSRRAPHSPPSSMPPPSPNCGGFRSTQSCRFHPLPYHRMSMATSFPKAALRHMPIMINSAPTYCWATRQMTGLPSCLPMHPLIGRT